MAIEYCSAGMRVKAAAGHAVSPSSREDGSMSRFPPSVRELLAPVVAAARAVLGDLDAEEVPAKLRRVVAYSGGRLPPPLADSVISELDTESWLRDKVAAELADDARTPAVAAFMDRGDAWWVELASAVADSQSAESAAVAVTAQTEARDAVTRLEVAKERVKKLKAELERERSLARKRKAPPDVSPARSAEEHRERARDVKRLELDLREAVGDRVEAEAMIARLRGRLRKVLREQRSQREGTGAGSSLGGDALAMARSLDLMAAAAPHRVEAPLPSPGAGDGPGALQLPKGVRPDAREALEWLAGLKEPVTLIVDGYNVAYNIDPSSFTTGSTREMLAQQLTRYRRSAGTMRVVVVFDSDLPGDRRERVVPGGAEVRFASEDLLADDEIVELAAAAKGAITVVSSDRDLRERSEAVGALTLWSEALVDWMTNR